MALGVAINVAGAIDYYSKTHDFRGTMVSLLLDTFVTVMLYWGIPMFVNFIAPFTAAFAPLVYLAGWIANIGFSLWYYTFGGREMMLSLVISIVDGV